MITLRFSLVIFLMAVALPAGAAAPQFFSSVPDLPLMEGLKELTDQTTTFDKPEGRIIESVALIESQYPNDVVDFYEQTLPQLGWRRIGDLTFKRENESLRLFIEGYEGRKFLRIAIAPASSFP